MDNPKRGRDTGVSDPASTVRIGTEPVLLRDLTIENYRSFEKYKLEGLARVNLLVGDNNCGKTSVLEAVHILIAQGQISCALETLSNRHSLRRFRGSRGATAHLPDALALFRRPVDPASAPGVANGLLPKFSIYECSHLQRRVEATCKLTEDQSVLTFETTAIARGDKYRQQSFEMRYGPPSSVVPAQPRRFGTKSERLKSVLQIPQHVFVPSNGISLKRIQEAWGTVLRERLDSLAVAALCLVEPEITQISLVPPVVSLSDILVDRGPERIQISELGGGAFQVLSLAISMAQSQRGTVLIDEIDTGLHHSRLSDVWRMVIKTAVELDVQVFATTHSLDCIRALSAACDLDESLREHVALFSIDRRMDNAVRFGAEDLAVVVDQEIEVR